MESKSKINFRPIDEWVFKQIDKFKDGQAYSRLWEWLSFIDHEYRDKVIVSALLLVLALPLLFVLIFFLLNRSTYNEYVLKKSMLVSAKEIIQIRRQSRSFMNQQFSTQLIGNKSNFDNIITNVAGRSRVDHSRIKTEQFSSFADGTLLQKAVIVLRFDDLTYKEVMEFIKNLALDKVRVGKLTIKKNVSKNLLDGSMELQFYGVKK